MVMARQRAKATSDVTKSDDALDVPDENMRRNISTRSSNPVSSNKENSAPVKCHRRCFNSYVMTLLCLIVVLTEPMWHFMRYKIELAERSMSQTQGTAFDSSGGAEIVRPQRHIDSLKPTPRNGMVPREYLRTKYILDSDPLLIPESVDNAASSAPASHKAKNHKVKPFTSKMYPRIVYLEQDDDDLPAKNKTAATKGKSNSRTPAPSFPLMELQGPLTNETREIRRKEYERSFFEDCTPMVDPDIHPSCNLVHEIPLDQNSDISNSNTKSTKSEDIISLLSVRGSWRSTWKVENWDHRLYDEQHENVTSDKQQRHQGGGEPVVMKMLHIHRKFDPESFAAHDLDIWVMDVLTPSPYVVDAYGYCGQTVLTEWAPTGAREHVKNNTMRNKERLKTARDLARGLADLHALKHLKMYEYDWKTDHNINPHLFSHNDINIANAVQVGGRIKWNDFNIGVLQRRKLQRKSNTTNSMKTDKDEACLAPVRFKGDLWRSPEEVRNTSSVDLEKTDMYGLGNIMFQVFTKHQPWTYTEQEEFDLADVVAKKMAGEFPDIPEKYKNATRVEVHALTYSTLSCFHPKPEKRPSAVELAYKLGKVYDWLKEGRPPAKQVRDLFMS